MTKEEKDWLIVALVILSAGILFALTGMLAVMA